MTETVSRGRRTSATHETAFDGFAPRHEPTFFDRVRVTLDHERARFFLWAPVFLGAGIAIYFAIPREPDLLSAALPLSIFLIAKLIAARGTYVSLALSALCLMGAGFIVAKLRVEHVRAPVLERPLRSVEVIGVVARAEPRVPRGQRLTLNVEKLGSLTKNEMPQRVRIRTLNKDSQLSPGDRVRLKATLAPPAKPALPGGFDYARTAWFERLGGVGYTLSRPMVEGRVEPGDLYSTVQQWIDQFRASVGARISQILPGETGAIARALITGERGGISEETNDAFRASGLFHILSISGLHMVVMAGAVFYAVRFFLALFPAIALRFPIKKIAAVAGMFAAVAYMAISGGAFATVRATVMIVIMFTAVLFDRPALALRNVALSAFLILALYPESLFDAGFQMSFAAVTGLIAAYEIIRQRMARRGEPHPILRVGLFFGGIVASTLIASAAVAPFAAYHFHQSQQYAVLANLVAIPICNIIVMPCALAALVLMPFGLEWPALWALGKGIEAMTWCAQTVGALPGAVGHIPAMPTLAFGLMVYGGLWLALWQTRWRLLGIGFVLAGLVLAPTLPRPDMLVTKGGELVALRLADGTLSALPARQSKFELKRWLEHDGDGREVDAAQKGVGFTCDSSGCFARVKGVDVAVPRHPSALVDDCVRARILLLSIPRPAWCAGPETVIDLFDVWRDAGYALYVDARGDSAPPVVRVVSIASFRGARPWSAPVTQRDKIASLPVPRVDGAGDDRKLGPAPVAQSREEPRPEIDDEDFEALLDSH
jgi:competence protein ComEC